MIFDDSTMILFNGGQIIPRSFINFKPSDPYPGLWPWSHPSIDSELVLGLLSLTHLHIEREETNHLHFDCSIKRFLYTQFAAQIPLFVFNLRLTPIIGQVKKVGPTERFQSSQSHVYHEEHLLVLDIYKRLRVEILYLPSMLLSQLSQTEPALYQQAFTYDDLSLI